MPFAGMGPTGFNPFASSASNIPNPNPSPMSDIDFEALSKRIDEKIAELEKEEAMEAHKEQQEKIQIDKSPEESDVNELVLINDIDIPDPNPQNIEFNDSKESEQDVNKPKVNVDSDSVIMDDNVADEEFFDDFFDEE